MKYETNFSGGSGLSYRFERLCGEDALGRTGGVVLFAAREGRGWKVIRLGTQSGVEGDVGIFWRWREARRFGATEIFFLPAETVSDRRAAVADLEAGLLPACGESHRERDFRFPAVFFRVVGGGRLARGGVGKFTGELAA